MTTTINETTPINEQEVSTIIEPLKFEYYSATKFVKFIDDAFKNGNLPVKPKRNETISSAYIWFNGNDTFTGKFNNYCIKYPLFIIFNTSIERRIKVDYQQFATIFKAKPVITFSQNWERSVPKGEQRKNIYELVIGFYPQQTKEGLPYFPTSVYREKIQSKINTIKKYINSEEWQNWTKTINEVLSETKDHNEI